MRSRLVIVLLLLSLATWAKTKPVVVAEQPEREQQFTYYFYAAHHALEHEQYDRALMLLRFCEELRANDAQTLAYLGAIYDAVGQTDLALDYYRRAYENAPYDLWQGYAKALMQRQSEDTKVRKQVVKMVEQVAQKRPKDVDAWDFLRQLYMHNQSWSKALRAQDRLDAILGYDANSAIHRYQVFVLQNKPKKALSAIDDYLVYDPANLRFMLFRIQLLEYTRAPWPQLVEAYSQVLQFDPNNALILNNYAYALAVRGENIREAERMSQRAIQIEPNNPVYLDTYAWILHLQGQDTLAGFYIRKAMENCKEENEEIKRHYEEIMHK